MLIYKIENRKFYNYTYYTKYIIARGILIFTLKFYTKFIFFKINHIYFS